MSFRVLGRRFLPDRALTLYEVPTGRRKRTTCGSSVDTDLNLLKTSLATHTPLVPSTPLSRVGLRRVSSRVFSPFTGLLLGYFPHSGSSDTSNDARGDQSFLGTVLGILPPGNQSDFKNIEPYPRSSRRRLWASMCRPEGVKISSPESTTTPSSVRESSSVRPGEVLGRTTLGGLHSSSSSV